MKKAVMLIRILLIALLIGTLGNVQATDLAITNFVAPSEVNAGEFFSSSWTVENQADDDTPFGYGWYDYLYWSYDNKLDPTDITVGGSYHPGSLGPGESYTTGWPTCLVSYSTYRYIRGGQHYLILKIAAKPSLVTVFDPTPENNILIKPVTLHVVDLVPTELVVSDGYVVTGQPFQISWTAENQENGEAKPYEGYWYDRLYLSKDTQPDTSDIYFDWERHDGPLAPGASYTETIGAVIPEAPPGQYYLLLVVDEWTSYFYAEHMYDLEFTYQSEFGRVEERDNLNNIIYTPVTVKGPDLVVTVIFAPGEATTQDAIEVTWTVENQGNGAAGWPSSEWCLWSDRLYLSTDDQLDESDVWLHNDYCHEGVLPPGESYEAEIDEVLLTWIPEVPPGDYYLIVAADDCLFSSYDSWFGEVYESNEENNILAIPITVETPDLEVTAIEAPDQASSQEQIEISWTVINRDSGEAKGYWRQWEGGPYHDSYGYGWEDVLYLSSDTHLDESDIFLTNYYHESLDADEAYTATKTVILPEVSGNHYLLVKTDEGDDIYESNEENNVLAQPIEVVGQLRIEAWSSGHFLLGEGDWSRTAGVPIHVQVLDYQDNPVEGAAILLEGIPYGQTGVDGRLDFLWPIPDSPPIEGTFKGEVEALWYPLSAESEIELYTAERLMHLRAEVTPDAAYWYGTIRLLTIYTGRPGVPSPGPKWGPVWDLYNVIISIITYYQEYHPSAGDLVGTDTYKYTAHNVDTAWLIRETAVRDSQLIFELNSWTEKETKYLDSILPIYSDPYLARGGLLINIASPAVPYITAPDGSHAGYDPLTEELVFDFPIAISDPGDEPFQIFIPHPAEGEYLLTVVGTGSGSYTLSVQALDSNGIGGEVSSFTNSITEGETHEYDIIVPETGDIIVAPQIIAATIDFDPDTLNLQGKGKWVTTYIELLGGYDVCNIDVSTVMLNDQVSAEAHPTEIGDYDDDGIIDLMVKFDRSAVQEILEVGDEVKITITGELTDGTSFKGSDTIRVIEKGK